MARARALLQANLHREARDAAGRAVAELMAGGAGADVAEARVVLATAELEHGQPTLALVTAGLARRALHRQGRPALAALADHVIVRARIALGRRDRRTVELAAHCADALGEVGLVAEELDARLTAGLVAASSARGTRPRCSWTACASIESGDPWWTGPGPGRPRPCAASTMATGTERGGRSMPVSMRWPTSSL